jgi:hypothetical protein
VIGINGAGGAVLWAAAEAARTTVNATAAAVFDGNTGRSSSRDSLLDGAHLSQKLAAMAGEAHHGRNAAEMP